MEPWGTPDNIGKLSASLSYIDLTLFAKFCVEICSHTQIYGRIN